MDRLETLIVFVRVAETKSFTEAGRTLGRPKASISNAVAELEERIGARLFTRTTRRVELTPDGALFYERCKDLLSDAEDVETLFQKTEQDLSGRIRIDVPSRMARYHIIPELPEFLAAHPGLQIELGASDRRVDLVREGYDCVVRVGELADSGYLSRRVAEFKLINCASPSYLAVHGCPQSLDDLSNHWLVHYTSVLGARPDGFEYEQDGEWQERPMRGRVSVNSAESYIAACLAGLGIIQTPCTSLEDDLRTGRLVEVLPEFRARSMPVHILLPPGRKIARRVRTFVDWLGARFAT